MKSNIILALTGLATTVMARTEIMLPLYAAPGGIFGSAEWNATIDAIRANPDMHFYVVINPNNGPKNTSSPGNGGSCNLAGPDYIEHGCNKDYSTNLARINALPNAQTVGYIYTRYGDQNNRSIDSIKEDIAEWALWDNATTWNFNEIANISIHGLWFDETGTTIGNRSEYEELTSYARDVFATTGPSPRNQFSIIMNPGSNPQTDYEPFLFAMADAVVTRETCWTSVPSDPSDPYGDCLGDYTPYDYREMYQGLGNRTAGLPDDPALNSKAVVIVHQVVDPPEANNQTLYEQILGTVRLGVHSAWFTSGNWSQETRLPASVGVVSEFFSRANREVNGG
ncbi:Spherulin-4 [Rhypophila sp. PSN 637]